MKKILSLIPLLAALPVVTIASSTPVYTTSESHSYCFKNRDIMYPLQETFDALKQTLMLSNLNIATVTKNDGVLTAKGNQYNPNEDSITTVTLTIDFQEKEKGKTHVRVIASYETIEKKSDTGQVGGAGITLPIPVPFTGRYTLVGQGNINDSSWYRGFFNSLDKILFENHMKYSHIKKEIEPIVVKIEETPKKVEPQIKSTTSLIESEKTTPPIQEQTPLTAPAEGIKDSTPPAEEIENSIKAEVEKSTETPKIEQPTTEIKTESGVEPTTPNNPQ